MDPLGTLAWCRGYMTGAKGHGGATVCNSKGVIGYMQCMGKPQLIGYLFAMNRTWLRYVLVQTTAFNMPGSTKTKITSSVSGKLGRRGAARTLMSFSVSECVVKGWTNQSSDYAVWLEGSEQPNTHDSHALSLALGNLIGGCEPGWAPCWTNHTLRVHKLHPFSYVYKLMLII